MEHIRPGRSIDRPTCGCVDEMKKSGGHESGEVKASFLFPCSGFDTRQEYLVLHSFCIDGQVLFSFWFRLRWTVPPRLGRAHSDHKAKDELRLESLLIVER